MFSVQADVDEAELAGGVLNDATDPYAAARELTRLVLASAPDPRAARAAGFVPDLVDVLRAQLGGDETTVATACNLGAAWVMGRRSAPAGDMWDLVASLPSGVALPKGLHRTTGETLIRLVVEATRTLRLVSPFIDTAGLDFLADALASATLRGVRLELLLPTRSTHSDDAISRLRSTIETEGDPGLLRVSPPAPDAPWAHLKVLTADSVVAYFGSANVTGAGMAGRNLELGVLVRGQTVAVIERVLDQFIRHETRPG